MELEASDSMLARSSSYSNLPTTARQELDQIQVYVDEHPYHADLVVPQWIVRQDQLPADGNGLLTLQWEAVVALLIGKHDNDLSMVPGNHTLYFVAVDTAGYKGPAEALRIQIEELSTPAPSLMPSPAVSALPSPQTSPIPTTSPTSAAPTLEPTTPRPSFINVDELRIDDSSGGDGGVTASPTSLTWSSLVASLLVAWMALFRI